MIIWRTLAFLFLFVYSVSARQLDVYVDPSGTDWNVWDTERIKLRGLKGSGAGDGSYLVYAKNKVGTVESSEYLAGTLVVSGSTAIADVQIGLFSGGPGGAGGAWGCGNGNGNPWAYVGAYETNDHITNISMTVTRVVKDGVEQPFISSPLTHTSNFRFHTSYGQPAVTEETSYLVVTLGGVVKHPQLLKLEWDNKTAFPMFFKVVNPQGANVYQGGTGKGGKYVGEWQPPDDAPVGVYKITAAWTDANGVVKFVELSSSTLSNAASGEWSKVWSVQEIKGTVGGDFKDGGKNPNGGVTNNDTGTHILRWKDASGQLVGDAMNVAGGGGGVGLDPRLDGLTAPAGGSRELTLVDTSDGGRDLGKLTLVNPGDGNPTTVSGKIVATINPPAPTTPPTPTTTQSNAGNQSVGTTGTGSAKTIVNNHDSTTITNQDIYNDVLKALQDALTPTAGGPSPSTEALNNREDELAKRGKLDDIQGAIDEGVTKTGQLKTGLIGKLDFSSNLAGIPTTLGTVSGISLGTFGGHSVGLDFTAASGAIVNVRAALLWLMTALFVVLCIHTVITDI